MVSGLCNPRLTRLVPAEHVSVVQSQAPVTHDATALTPKVTATSKAHGTLLRARPVLRTPGALQRELEELRSREEKYKEDISRWDQQLRLASVIQRDLLPSRLPAIDGLDVHILYHPLDMLSGDSYDVIRLDDSHVAFSLSDATGHGLPAALLSAFVKRSLRGRERMDRGERFLEPDEVLARVNSDLLDTELEECQFVAALYAVYDVATRTIRWARGGTPYPILARCGRRPDRIISEGPIVGACNGPRFELVERQLDPGDTLIFHTDGLEALLLKDQAHLGCCGLDRTDWFHALGRRSLLHQLEEVQERLVNFHEADGSADDVTILALQVHPR